MNVAVGGFGARRRSRRSEPSLFGLGSSPLLAATTIVVVILAVLLGGGTQPGLGSDAVVGIVSLALLAIVLPASLGRLVSRPTAAQALVVAVIILVPLYELLPLPPGVWTALPGRATVVAAYQDAGMALPWLPVSLDALATQRSLLALVPAIAVFLAVSQLSARTRRTLTVVMLALSLASVLLGLAQVMQGTASALRLFEFTHARNSVGFFANRNHFAALLYVLIPLASAWIIGVLAFQRSSRMIGVAVFMLTYVALLLGLGMAASRAGMTLAICGAVTSLALAAIARTKATRAISIMAIPIVLGLLVVAEFALLTLVGRFGADPLGDYRFRIASTTIEAAQTFQPVGSGIGTFVPVYQIYERNADLIVTYVNHAHDDWLELWLEGGWPILAVIACGLAWLVRATVRAWRTPDTGESYATIDRALPRAASIGLVLLLAHSVVDYPLRTTALSVVFAILAALLTPAPRRQQPLGTIPGAP